MDEFHCKFCMDKFSQLKQYLCHLKHHRHVSETFPCALMTCSEVLPSEGSLRNHLLRRHNIRVTLLRERAAYNALDAQGKIACNVPSCVQEFDSFSKLMSHLRDHIIGGYAVKCPSCNKRYSVFGSLKGHVFRSHQWKLPSAISECDPYGTDDTDSTFVNFDEETQDVCASEANLSRPNHEMWLRAMAEFYMTLEFKYLVPARTVQAISCEMHSVHRNGMSTVLAIMDNESLSNEEKYAKMREVIAKFESGFSDLRSSHTRNLYFKRNFMYVAPTKVGKIFHYVPILKTLQMMVATPCLQIDLCSPTSSGRDIYTDFYDGLLYKTNLFFRENRKAFSVILYQDGFEISCPIGPAKKKYKMIGIYLSLGNIPSHIRTHTDAIQLVGLCLESNFDHEKVYGPIVADLKKLEEVGVEIPGHGMVKGSLIYVSGDNLGSHGLGGFNESFSKSRYFCRYCLVPRASFHAEEGHLASFPERTRENYNACIGKRGIEGRKGIKFESKFNELQNFHVCDPGLPPCLGHDLMEGVAAHDVCLFFKYFVDIKKWFSYDDVAAIMSAFPYSAADRRDKPLPLKEKHTKVHGGMWQVYNFVRLVPLMIHHLIQDKADPVWKLFLLIGEILDIVCAPTIHKSYVGHLQVLIVEYLDMRRHAFPLVPLRPKHHYFTHYCLMILLFGSLGKVWTLRYESKHQFFNRAIRASKNFINVTFSCAERHELFQAYVRAGGGLRCALKAVKTSPFVGDMYCNEIRGAVQKVCNGELTQCLKYEIKGTVYSKGMILALSQLAYQVDVSMGRIVFILEDNEGKIYFLVEVLQSEYNQNVRMHEIGNLIEYNCIAYDNLASPFPMHAYNYKMKLFVKLKYALVSEPMSFENDVA
ncbi:uncharacterized protein LOC117640489 [Thrips palmi]|uniref:Uncharacterized protein LOC117640489 n=1 Tax=Thrips palmi TaxID=161013 RepID=A0A6P8ZI32_THRPL|nr:uncharacterized protein LOC117640489 [Thrips palmi]